LRILKQNRQYNEPTDNKKAAKKLLIKKQNQNRKVFIIIRNKLLQINSMSLL